MRQDSAGFRWWRLRHFAGSNQRTIQNEIWSVKKNWIKIVYFREEIFTLTLLGARGLNSNFQTRLPRKFRSFAKYLQVYKYWSLFSIDIDFLVASVGKVRGIILTCVWRGGEGGVRFFFESIQLFIGPRLSVCRCFHPWNTAVPGCEKTSDIFLTEY